MSDANDKQYVMMYCVCVNVTRLRCGVIISLWCADKTLIYTNVMHKVTYVCICVCVCVCGMYMYMYCVHL